MRHRRGRFLLVRYAALTVLAFLFAFPFYWMFVTSMEPRSRLSDLPPDVLPLWDWQNYADAWNAAPWGRYFLNTVFVSSAATALALVTALLAGYTFGSLRFPAKRLLFLAVLMVLVIPDEVILIPQYLILGDLNWLNTYQAQIVPFGASAFGIFLLRQFFQTVPRELWDAAQLDGCTRTGYLVHIAAPLARPALAAVGLYTFLGMWNQFLYPLVVAGLDPNVQPLQVGLASFLGVHSVESSQLAAASVFTTLPLVFAFLLAQKQIIEGVASTGVGALKA
ncbi:MAG: carbohydrate transporter permease [Chloroflexi bacterium]|nr:carbohydrate transporter permease [Chloroflexota bacterium]